MPRRNPPRQCRMPRRNPPRRFNQNIASNIRRICDGYRQTRFYIPSDIRNFQNNSEALAPSRQNNRSNHPPQFDPPFLEIVQTLHDGSNTASNNSTSASRPSSPYLQIDVNLLEMEYNDDVHPDNQYPNYIQFFNNLRQSEYPSSALDFSMRRPERYPWIDPPPCEEIPFAPVNALEETTTETSSSNVRSSITIPCPVCLDTSNRKQMYSTVCGHIVCKDCISIILRNSNYNNRACPQCRKKITHKDVHPIFL